MYQPLLASKVTCYQFNSIYNTYTKISYQSSDSSVSLLQTQPHRAVCQAFMIVTLTLCYGDRISVLSVLSLAMGPDIETVSHGQSCTS